MVEICRNRRCKLRIRRRNGRLSAAEAMKQLRLNWKTGRECELPIRYLQGQSRVLPRVIASRVAAAWIMQDDGNTETELDCNQLISMIEDSAR